MTEIRRIFPAKKSFYYSLFIIAVALALLAPKSAVNVDEQLHYPHAKQVVNWYFTGGKDASCLDTPVTNLKYYGQSVDNFTALFNRVFQIENEFLVRHFTGAAFFWLLLLFSGLLAKNITGSWNVATAVVFSLVFMPRLAGQAFGNLKDIPFTAGYTAGLLLIVNFLKEMPRPQWRTAILLGAAIAFTVSVRAGGFVLFAFLALSMFSVLVLKPSLFKQIFAEKTVFIRLLSQGVAILLIGYFGGLLFWPYALQQVITHPLESLRVMEHYKVGIRQIFEGEMFWSVGLPWYYLPKWLLMSTPLFVLSSFFLFLWFYVRSFFKEKTGERQFFEGFILFAFLFPVVYVMAIKSNLYSGVRQMLFTMPPLAILSVTGICKFLSFLKTRTIVRRYGFSALLFLLLIFTVKHQMETFPADYIYFNPLWGGNKKAWSNYEYDYYFHGIKQPADDLIELAGQREITVAMNCNLSNYFDNRPNINYVYTRFLERSSADWDYAIFGINYIHPYLLKNNLWQPANILKTYFHKGNPVAVLIERTDKTDFEGISEIKLGNLQKGIKLLESALEKEPENVWLFVNLLQAKLSSGDLSDFSKLLDEGKKIHPRYEPLCLLEADYLYRQGDFDKSYGKLRELLEINPRYLPAEPLLKKLEEREKLYYNFKNKRDENTEKSFGNPGCLGFEFSLYRFCTGSGNLY